MTSEGNVLINGLYESPSGVLAKSIYQLSGKYKILISSRKNNYDIYLADYSGYKVKIDFNRTFMSQLGDFLKRVNYINPDRCLYAGYSDHGILSYHIPYYISNQNIDFPTHCIILKTPNLEISETNISTIYQDSETIDVIDLQSTNILSILEEIKKLKLDNPVRLYWKGDNQNHSIIINGYDYVNNCITQKEISIREYVLNNNSTEDDYSFFNKLILRFFEENNMIYPMFLNFEFEFDYSKFNEDVDIDFQNFYAFLSSSELVKQQDFPVNKSQLPTDSKIIKTYRYKNKETLFTDINFLDPETLVLKTFQEVYSNVMVQDINEQDYLYRVKPQRITKNDIISITITSDNTSIIDYQVKESDIKNTLRETLIHIAKQISYNTNSFVDVVVNDSIWYFYSSIQLTYKFYAGGRISSLYKILDRYNNASNYYNSMNIGLNDICSKYEILQNKLSIDGVLYTINDKFKYDGRNIIRLNNNPRLTENKYAEILVDVTEKFQKFKPVDVINSYNLLFTLPLFDFDSFASEINNPNYVKLFDAPKQSSNEIPNTSPLSFINGSNSLASIHSLNYDTRFDVKNNNFVDFGYFLINGQAPNYLRNDYRINRYFDESVGEKPKMYSVFRRISSKTCETVFLGVKYFIDIKYEGYKFCVYLNTVRKIDKPDYYHEIDNLEKTICVVINIGLKFSGVNSIDLSLFYNINNSFTLSDVNINLFPTIGYLFGDKITKTDYERIGSIYDDFIVNDNFGNKSFLVVRDIRSENAFNELYSDGTTIMTKQYSNVLVDGDIKQFVVFRIIFKDIKQVSRDYFLCDDIIIEPIMGEVDDDITDRSINSPIYTFTDVKSLIASIDETGLYHDLSQNIINIDSPTDNILEQYSQHVDNITDLNGNALQIWTEMYLSKFINSEPTPPFNIPRYLQSLLPIIPSNYHTVVVNPNEANFKTLFRFVSLKANYFRLEYTYDEIGQDVNTPTTIYYSRDAFRLEHPSYVDAKIEQIVNPHATVIINPGYTYHTYDAEFKELVKNQSLNTINKKYIIDLFSTNKFWDIISRSCKNMLSNILSETYLRNFINNFSFNSFNYIINDNNFGMGLKIIPSDKNISKTSELYERYSVGYNPYLTSYTIYNVGSVSNIFDTNSNELKEYNGILSSLFIGKTITINASINSDTAFLDTILSNSILESRIIQLINTPSKIEYARYILDKMYNVESITVNDLIIPFNYNKSNYKLDFENNINICKIILKRI